MPRYYYRHIFKDLPENEKERLRQEAVALVQRSEDKELKRLAELGYAKPKHEYLRRLAAEAKNVKFKAKKKGIF